MNQERANRKGPMANEEHLALLREGATAWNAWRRDNPHVRPDLADAPLRASDLREADLRGAILRAADLRGTDLRNADLAGADLSGANLFKAVIDGANVAGADLAGAQFLNCAQLVVSRGWQQAFRDEDLGCGAEIPQRRGQN